MYCFDCQCVMQPQYPGMRRLCYRRLRNHHLKDYFLNFSLNADYRKSTPVTYEVKPVFCLFEQGFNLLILTPLITHNCFRAKTYLGNCRHCLFDHSFKFCSLIPSFTCDIVRKWDFPLMVKTSDHNNERAAAEAISSAQLFQTP